MGLLDGIKKKMEEIEHRRIEKMIYSQPYQPFSQREVPAEIDLDVEMDWEEGSKKQQSWANRLLKEFLKEVKTSLDDAVKERIYDKRTSRKAFYGLEPQYYLSR